MKLGISAETVPESVVQHALCCDVGDLMWLKDIVWIKTMDYIVGSQEYVGDSALYLVSCSQSFILTAEGPVSKVAFIDQELSERLSDWNVKHPITVCFV